MTSPEGARAPWQTKTYVASFHDNPQATEGAIVVEQAGGGGYPLPFVDAHEHGRRYYGEHTAATPVGHRTFHWGYGGAGPRETAASILADHFGVPQPIRLVHDFKWEVLAGRPQRQGWTLTGAEVQAWVDRHAVDFAKAWAEVAEREAEEAELARLQALEDQELGRG